MEDESKEIMEELDKLLHKVEEVIGDIKKAQEIYSMRTESMVRDLLICRSTILNIVEKL